MHETAIGRPLRISGLLVVAALAGCSPGVQSIEPAALAEHLAEGKAGPVFHLIDLRPEEAFAHRHLPGARSLPYARLASDAALFRDGKPVIFYDEGAPDAARIGAALGRRLPDHIVVLAGGLEAWIKAGLPLAGEGP